MKLGAADYLTKPFNMDEVRIVSAYHRKNISSSTRLKILQEHQSQLLKRSSSEHQTDKRSQSKGEKIAQAHVSACS